MRLLTAFFVMAGVAELSGGENLHLNLTAHLGKLDKHRYLNGSFQHERASVQKYIRQCFKEYDLDVEFQYYIVPEEPHSSSGNLKQAEATNIIGTAGMENSTGPMVVVGAAYDTNGKDDPKYYNGAGVAVMLEVARVFMRSTAGKPRFPVVFVAFDLGSEKCLTEGSRLPGGWVFVQDWLLPRLRYNPYTFEGAIILGPVMNINTTENITTIPEHLREIFPSLNERAQKEGDFLALFSHPSNTRLSEDLRRLPSWLEQVPLTQEGYKNTSCLMPIREAQHFWAATSNTVPNPLPAVVLTDLEYLRVKPRSLEITQAGLDVAEATVRGINYLLCSYHVDAYEDAAWLVLVVLWILIVPLLIMVAGIIISERLQKLT